MTQIKKRSYIGTTPPPAPKNTAFDNFVTHFDENNPNNNNSPHISFNRRNGDWLEAELIGTNIPFTDCSAFCANAEISGPDELCFTETFSVTNAATTVNWTVTDPNNLVNQSISGNSIVLTTNPFSGVFGTVTLNVTYGNGACGNTTVSKTIEVGRPAYPVGSQMSGDPNVLAGQYKTYTVPNADGATSYNWSFDYGGSITNPPFGAWQILNGQGTTSIFVKIGSYSNTVVVRCSAINNCSSTMKYMYVNIGSTGGGGGGGDDPDPCGDETMMFSSNPFSSSFNANNTINLIDPDPCDDDPNQLRTSGSGTLHEINIYNDYGVKVYSKKKKGKVFKIRGLRRGLYIVQYQTKKGKLLTKKLMVN